MLAVSRLKISLRVNLTKKKARTGEARAKKEFIINKIVKLRLGNTTIKDYSTKTAQVQILFLISTTVKKSPYRYGLISELETRLIITWKT